MEIFSGNEEQRNVVFRIFITNKNDPITHVQYPDSERVLLLPFFNFIVVSNDSETITLLEIPF
jgi:hypothetical protein